MHLVPFLLLVLLLPSARAGTLAEHLRLIAHPGPGAGCANRLEIRGILPNGHGEDQLHADDALSTVIVTDLLHMNRLFHVMERIQFSLEHSSALRGMDPGRVGHTPWTMIRANLKGYEDSLGAEYIKAAFGDELLGILENDNDNAERTSALLRKQKEILRRMAYAVKYHYAWRLIFMDMHPDVAQRGNRSFAQCMQEWKLTYPPTAIREMLASISAQTETELLKDRSGMYAPLDVARRRLSFETWASRFPTRHLPEIGVRGIEYLRANLEMGPIGESAVYLRILEDLSTAVVEYHHQVEVARRALPASTPRRIRP